MEQNIKKRILVRVGLAMFHLPLVCNFNVC